jgi:glutamyl-tRNA(Gln) amidotransferase subunit E
MLLKKIKDPKNWKINSLELPDHVLHGVELPGHAEKAVAVNLPGFQSALSWFTQPGKMFADELAGRLKVIACIEYPNMLHSEELEPSVPEEQWQEIRELMKAGKEDAQIIITGPAEDMKTALETVEERCLMALEGIPNETRKSFADGTTTFERVLPGADRMYPDTDSAPIPLEDEYIESLKKNLPEDIIDRYEQLKAWGVPEDTYTYIFSKNYFPVIQQIVKELGTDPKFTGTFFGHTLKHAKGKYKGADVLYGKKLFKLFKFLKEEKLEPELAKEMLPFLLKHPKMDFTSVLNEMNFKRKSKKEIISNIAVLNEKFRNGKEKQEIEEDRVNWVMGQLRKQAVGNISLAELSEEVQKRS